MRHILLSLSPLFVLELEAVLHHFTILLHLLFHLFLRHDFSVISSPLTLTTLHSITSSIFLRHLHLSPSFSSSIFSFIFIFCFPFSSSFFSDIISQLSGLNIELEDEKGFNQIVTEKQDKRVETLVRQNVHLQVRH